jgi:hypothetical protein
VGVAADQGDLRFCLSRANAQVGEDLIIFSVTGTINLTKALPDITDDLIIAGPGADQLTVRRDTGGDYRILTVAAGTVQVFSATLANGRADVGGGVYNQATLTLGGVIVTSSVSTAGQGGGVYNGGVLTLADSAVTGNTIKDVNSAYGAGLYNASGAAADLAASSVSGNTASPFIQAIGVGVANFGSMTIADGSVSGNADTIWGNSGAHAYGGGLANFGTLAVASSAISGNYTQEITLDGDGDAAGGGVYNTGVLSLQDSTVDANRADGEEFAKGGGIANFGSVVVDSSTVADNMLGGAYPWAEGAGIFNNEVGTPASLNVIHCTIAGNDFAHDAEPGRGGGIYGGGNVTVRDSAISDNLLCKCTPDRIGGGIFVPSSTGSSAAVSNTVIAGNFAFFGGGVDNDGTLTLDGVVISGNSAGDFSPEGGGVFNSGRLTVTGSLINQNGASGPDSAGSGGGIYNYKSGTLTLMDTTVDANYAMGSGPWGGGISNFGSIYVYGTTISNNTAKNTGNLNAGWGAGIFNGGSLQLVDSTVSGNQCLGSNLDQGGGVFAGGSASAVIRNSTIAGNQCQTGGGLVVWGSSVDVRNSVFANSAVLKPDLSGSLTSSAYDLFQNSTGGSGFGPTDLLDVDAQLGPLQDNGGPTQTMALMSESPAIDSGDNTGAPDWDQRGPGYPRIVNGTIDRGAFEVQNTAGPVDGRSVLVTAPHPAMFHLDAPEPAEAPPRQPVRTTAPVAAPSAAWRPTSPAPHAGHFPANVADADADPLGLGW